MLVLQTYSIKAKDESISRTTARLSDKSNSCRCLDAAHGKSPAAIVAVKRRYRIRDGAQKTSIGTAGSGRRRRPTAGLPADIRQNTRRRVAVARSRRKEQSLKGMRRRVRNNGLCYECRCVYFVRNVGRSLRGTLAGLRCGRLRPARLKEPNDGDCKSFARTDCDRPTSTTLLCHSERSEESFPLRTKGRLRTMPRKEEKGKRSAVKNLSTYTFIQILRRSSDLLRMTILPLH